MADNFVRQTNFDIGIKKYENIKDEIKQSPYSEKERAKKLIDSLNNKISEAAEQKELFLYEIAKAFFVKGNEYLNEKKYDKSINQYKKAISEIRSSNYRNLTKFKNLVSQSETKLEKAEKLYRKTEDFYFSIGINGAAVLGIKTSETFKFTVQPGLYFDYVKIFEWGKLGFGIEGSFAYLKPKNADDSSYVINIPANLRIHYITNFNRVFSIYAGINGGIIISRYSTANSSDNDAMFHLVPDAGMSFAFTPSFSINTGSMFDIEISSKDTYLYINPYLSVEFRF